MPRITMTTQEAAEYLGVGYTKMLQLIAAKEVPSIKLGRLYYFKKDKLDEWMDKKMDEPEEPEPVSILDIRRRRKA